MTSFGELLVHLEERRLPNCYGRNELNTNVILVDKGNYSATQQRYSIYKYDVRAKSVAL